MLVIFITANIVISTF